MGPTPRVPAPHPDPPASVTPLPAMTPKELSDVDDACTAAIVDPFLGFATHKMSLRFRHPTTKDQRAFKRVVNRFRQHQSYEETYEGLQQVEWWKRLTGRRPRLWQAMLKEHVSNIILSTGKLSKFPCKP